MAWPRLDPQYEQRLREEVIYLHYLWHQGPPRAAAAQSSLHHHHLQPQQPTQFQRERNQEKKSSTHQPSNSSPGPEWAVPDPPPQPPSDAWPNQGAKLDRQPLTLTSEEQLKLAGKNAHQRALKLVTEFFRYRDADDDSDSIGSVTEWDEDLLDGDDGREEYSFFYKVFKEDTELREYYEKNFVRGEFGCLVCGALGGKKTGKKYKGCLALVQHSTNIAKTKKKTAHRAFGLAVCKVLSWDITELSSIVSLLAQGKDDGENKENSVAVLNNVVSVQGNIVEGKNEEAVSESRPSGSGILPDGDEENMNPSSCSDAYKNWNILGCYDDNDTPLVTQTVLNVEIDAVKGENDEAAPESGAVGAGDLPSVDGNTGIDSGYDKEIPSASIENVLTVEGDAVKSKTDVVPESGAIGPGSSSAGDVGDMVPENVLN
ncbi:hypothetical protein STAS_30719 [Striga asiatica]|uniref:Uncharacterized protein n=1 Tax=Striga asiatica TaxID=4170 RepID=A0A5A7RA88_STRAF|nr:hypothetical protein STAS_30719 [Striga asiatica]